MAKIGVSGFFVQPGRVGGAEHMVGNLMRGLAKIQHDGDEISFFSNAPMAAAVTFDPVRYVVLPRPRLANRFVEDAVLLRRYRGAFDSVLFPNYFTPPVRSGARLVTVIHDLQYRHFPENFGRKKCLWLRWSQELTLRRADQVIAISEFVRQDLLDHHGDRFADKIMVIPNPVSWERLEEPCGEPDALRVPTAPYILSVAAHYPHKNLETLIRAFAKVRRVFPEYRLVLAGQLPGHLVGMARYARVEECIRALGLEEAVQVTGHVSDALLGALYRRATLFVFPSLFEGFGMPPVEALGLGLPVVTTRRASLPETTMGLATYVDDPLSADELAERIIGILASPSAYRPTEDEQRKLRLTYSPESVARAYYSALA